jgi:hypothetical protein
LKFGRTQDTGHAGWVDPEATDFEKYVLLVEDVFAVAEERHSLAICLGPAGQSYPRGFGFSGLGTIDA